MFGGSTVCGDLRADICFDERSFVTYPTLPHAGQHHAFSDDVLRHDAHRSNSQQILPRHGDSRRRTPAVHYSILSVDVLQRSRYSRHHQLLDADLPFRRHSTSCHLLPDTGESMHSLSLNLVILSRLLSLC